jgi:hypothetical protein
MIMPSDWDRSSLIIVQVQDMAEISIGVQNSKRLVILSLERRPKRPAEVTEELFMEIPEPLRGEEEGR